MKLLKCTKKKQNCKLGLKRKLFRKEGNKKKKKKNKKTDVALLKKNHFQN